MDYSYGDWAKETRVFCMPIYVVDNVKPILGINYPAGKVIPWWDERVQAQLWVAHIYIFTTWGILETKTSVDIVHLKWETTLVEN